MIGHRAIVSLSLLCALVFCAFAAPSASAAGTTAFTCAAGTGASGFEDAHCDRATSEKAKVNFVHEAIVPNAATEISLSNEKTAEETTKAQPSVLIGPIGGTEVKVTCNSVSGTGTLTNEEVGGVMQTAGSAVIEHSSCTVLAGGKTGCTVKEPIVYKAKFKTYQNETAMGIEFTPKEGKEFGAVTYEGGSCPVKGTFGIDGSFLGTPGGTAKGIGATLWFNDGGKLNWGGNPYTPTGRITLRMKGGGNAISLTTT